MSRLTLDQSRSIVGAALAKGRAEGLKPLTVVVLDAGGHVIAAEREDGSSNMRFDLAFGKANAAPAMGLGTRSLMQRAEQQAYFVQAANGHRSDRGPFPRISNWRPTRSARSSRPARASTRCRGRNSSRASPIRATCSSGLTRPTRTASGSCARRRRGWRRPRSGAQVRHHARRRDPARSHARKARHRFHGRALCAGRAGLAVSRATRGLDGLARDARVW